MAGENPGPWLLMTALGITALAYTVPFLKAIALSCLHQWS